MRIISTKMHAMMDYVAGLMLVIVPLFWLGQATYAIWVPVAVGGLMLVMSLFTDYELSISDSIPMPVHLMMDAIAGAVLAASPWLFGFADVVWIPHLVIGLLEIGGALMTKTHRGTPAGTTAAEPSRHAA